MLSKIIRGASIALALIAAVSAGSASCLWFYQPKAPKSLMK